MCEREEASFLSFLRCVNVTFTYLNIAFTYLRSFYGIIFLTVGYFVLVYFATFQLRSIYLCDVVTQSYAHYDFTAGRSRRSGILPGRLQAN